MLGGPVLIHKMELRQMKFSRREGRLRKTEQSKNKSIALSPFTAVPIAIVCIVSSGSQALFEKQSA